MPVISVVTWIYQMRLKYSRDWICQTPPIASCSYVALLLFSQHHQLPPEPVSWYQSIEYLTYRSTIFSGQVANINLIFFLYLLSQYVDHPCTILNCVFWISVAQRKTMNAFIIRYNAITFPPNAYLSNHTEKSDLIFWTKLFVIFWVKHQSSAENAAITQCIFVNIISSFSKSQESRIISWVISKYISTILK